MRVRLVQIDGKLPNLALMKLAHWHRARGDDVVLTREINPTVFDELPGVVYGSAIFAFSSNRVRALLAAYPDAIVGGTGSGGPLGETVESVIGVEEYECYDYSIYPEFPWSLGFTQRGCRLRCGFCVVPEKEGRPRPVNRVYDIWRPGSPRCLLLLDNDFFGQPKDHWQARVEELRAGNFKVSFNQGVNIRLVDDDAAAALASVRYYDAQFKRRRLYTAWDRLGDETIFFRGLERLQAAGIPARHLMVYMLVGYLPNETMDEVMHRYHRLREAGCKPFPMVYDRTRRDLVGFQRWVVRRYDEVVPWEEYRNHWKPSERVDDRQRPLLLPPPEPANILERG